MSLGTAVTAAHTEERLHALLSPGDQMSHASLWPIWIGLTPLSPGAPAPKDNCVHSCEERVSFGLGVAVF